MKAIRKILETSEYEDYYLRNDVLFKGEELMVIPASMEDEIIEIVIDRETSLLQNRTPDTD